MNAIGMAAYNNVDILPACLASLDAYTAPHSVRYVFVDNASEDDTAEAFTAFLQVERHQPGYLVQMEENTGCCQGWNKIFQQCLAMDPEPENLILLNSDIQILRPGWVDELVDGLYADDIAVVEAACVLHHPGGPLQHVGSAATLYRFSALKELWHAHAYRVRQDGPWDAETFFGWSGDLDVFAALRSLGYWPALARQGVHAVHICGCTETVVHEGRVNEEKAKASAKCKARWGKTGCEQQWWGRRRIDGALETIVDSMTWDGPTYKLGVNVDVVKEVYPWL